MQISPDALFTCAVMGLIAFSGGCITLLLRVASLDRDKVSHKVCGARMKQCRDMLLGKNTIRFGHEEEKDHER